MIHSYDMTAALAEQRRSQLEAEAVRHRLVRDARRVRSAGTRRPIRQHLRARTVRVLAWLDRRRSNDGGAPTSTVPVLLACPADD